MNKGAICSMDWPLLRRNVASINLPECGRFSPFSSTCMACLIQGGYSVDTKVVEGNFLANDKSFLTGSSKPCNISGVFVESILELM